MAEEKKDTIHEDMKKLIEQNIELSKKILKLSKRNNKMLNWQKLWGFLKVVLIFIPIILGFIYLPPLFEGMLEFYRDLLGLSENVKNLDSSFIDFEKLTPEFIKNFKK